MGAVNFGNNLTEEQRVERVIYKVLSSRRWILFSGLLMVGTIEVVDDHPTAYTDGVNIKLGREFIRVLNDKQLLFVLIHELMHMAYRHTIVWRSLYERHPQVANMACDFVINLQIVDMDPHGNEVEFPTDENGELLGCYDEQYRDMDAKQVFNKIYEDNGLEDGQGTNEGWGVVSPDGQNKPNSFGELLKKQFDEHGWDEAKALTPEQEDELREKIDGALRQGAQLAGRLNGDVSRDIKKLLAPKVKWEDVLRDFVKATCKGHDDATFKRFHKRFVGVDIFLPTTIAQKVGKVLVGLDTSGSIGDTLLGRFLGELTYIADEVKPDGIILLYWDTEVASVEQYGKEDMHQIASSTKPAGGGGTNPVCVPVWMADGANKDVVEDVVAVVMLTDGYFYNDDGGSAFEQLGVPVLWCVVGNESFVPSYGVSVYVDKE
jgi:predicted metal-dependent peptidase